MLGLLSITCVVLTHLFVLFAILARRNAFLQRKLAHRMTPATVHEWLTGSRGLPILCRSVCGVAVAPYAEAFQEFTRLTRALHRLAFSEQFAGHLRSRFATFILTLGVVASSTAVVKAQALANETRVPNIVLILADDKNSKAV